MTIYAKAPFKHVTEFNNSTIAELFDTPEFTAAVNAIAGGGGLEGTNYIYVPADGTPSENAAQLIAAYNTAKTMSPNWDKIITVIAAPGEYFLDVEDLTLDTQYINLVSLTGTKSVILNSWSGYTINVTANYVYVAGIDAKWNNLRFKIADNLWSTVIENCSGGSYSFGSQGGQYIGSTFKNCESSGTSFASNQGDAAGTFINCTARYQNSCFGGNLGTCSGYFKDCIAGDYGFTFYGNATGTFINCIAGEYSFSRNASASGYFYNCRAGNFSFGSRGNAAGYFYDCIAGYQSFGGGTGGTASGFFVNCTASNNSFGQVLANGEFYNCVCNGSDSFAYNSGSTGTASGQFHYCVSYGGFAQLGNLTGKLYYCRLVSGSGTFSAVSSGGKTRYCIDGNDTANNQG